MGTEQRLLIAGVVLLVIVIALYFAYHKCWLNSYIPTSWANDSCPQVSNWVSITGSKCDMGADDQYVRSFPLIVYDDGCRTCYRR
jgi:hypothetical protein